MANPENLKSFTHENAAENGRKGALAAAKTKRRRKALKELLKIALFLPSKGDRSKTSAEAMVAAIIQLAEEGNVKAFETIRDTIGEKPDQKLDVTNSDGSLSPLNITVTYIDPQQATK